MKAASTGRRAGLSRELIAEKAVELSATTGVEGWSVRDIAGALDVVPSVIYHYFPNKEAICDAVVDKVCAHIEVPDASLEWKPWFRTMAHNLRPALLAYPGITNRLTQGKITEQFLPLIDAAWEKLQEAGFGEKSAVAYTIITNSLIQAIEARNLRSPNQTQPRHDLNTTLARFEAMMPKSVGLTNIVNAYLEPLSHPEREDAMSEEYYELVITVILDGIENTLLPPLRPVAHQPTVT